jgi:hypothetical protein
MERAPSGQFGGPDEFKTESPSLRRQAPVDDEFRAGRERGFVAGEKQPTTVWDLSAARNFIQAHLLIRQDFGTSAFS